MLFYYLDTSGGLQANISILGSLPTTILYYNTS